MGGPAAIGSGAGGRLDTRRAEARAGRPRESTADLIGGFMTAADLSNFSNIPPVFFQVRAEDPIQHWPLAVGSMDPTEPAARVEKRLRRAAQGLRMQASSTRGCACDRR